MIQVFYHEKGQVGITHIWRTERGIKQIRSDMKGNCCVLDAIYYEESKKVTLYSKNLRKDDIYGNLL